MPSQQPKSRTHRGGGAYFTPFTISFHSRPPAASSSPGPSSLHHLSSLPCLIPAQTFLRPTSPDFYPVFPMPSFPQAQQFSRKFCEGSVTIVSQSRCTEVHSTMRGATNLPPRHLQGKPQKASSLGTMGAKRMRVLIF